MSKPTSEELEKSLKELEKAEQDLKESDKRYRQLFENIGDAIIVFSSKGNFLNCNKVTLQRLGYSLEEFLSLKPADIVHPDFHQLMKENQKKLWAGESTLVESVHLCKDGTTIPVEVNSVMIEYMGITAILAVVRDITERKKTEEALTRSNTAIETSLNAVFTSDIEGKITYANPAAAKMWGFKDTNKMIGTNVINYWTKGSQAKAVEIINILAQEGSYSGEGLVGIRKDGSEFFVGMQSTMIMDASGNPVGMVGSFEDITARKKAEEELKEREEELSQIYDSVGDVLFYISVEPDDCFRFLSINQMFLKSTGLTEDQIVGKRIEEVIPEPSISIVRDNYKKAIKENGIIRWEEISVYPTGEKAGLVSITPVLNENGICTHLAGSVHDITERKKILEDLKVSKEYTKNIINSSLDIIISVNKNRRIVEFNNAAQEAFGYTKEEIIGKHANILYADEKTGKKVFKTIKSSGVFKGEVLNKRKNGDVFPAYLSGSIIKGKDSDAIGYMGISHDITKRKKAEEELQESNEIFSQFMEYSPIYVFFKDKDIRSLRLSRNYEQMLGQPIDELLGKTMDDLFPSDLAKSMVADDQRVLKEGKPITIEEELNGRFYETIKFPVFIDGKPKYLSGFTIDITERKKAEEEMRLSEIQLRQIIDLVPHNIYARDEKGIFILANKISADSLNTTVEKIIGTRDSDYYHKKDVNKFLESDREVLRSNRPVSYQLTQEHKGILRTYNVTKIPFRVSGTGEPAVLGVGIDITESLQLDEERVKASKLESIGILAGGIAHDFNNILTVIMGNTSLAKMRLDNISEAEKLLSEVEKASLRAKDLTQQLLTFAKGGAPVKEITELTELIRETTKFSLRGSNVQYRTSISPDLWIAEVDKGQISQAVGNLVINAKQAMPEGGTINIKAKNVTVTPVDNLPLKEGNYVKISLEDKGSGITEDHLSKIFDPFFTTKQKGSGLGLTTTYSIIHGHDGHITVESEIGVGSTFHIYLPASVERIEGEKAVKEDTAVLAGKILVMDDEKEITNIVSKTLIRGGSEVEVASNGDEAIEIYKKAMDSGNPFDVVIMDLTIPGGMGGKKTIKKLLEIDPDAKAIVSSGYSNDPVISNFEAYGFRDKISKPFELKDLIEVLNKVIKA